MSVLSAAASKMSSSLVQKGLPALTSSATNVHAPVAKWILATGGLVVGMVHVGGVTRLTKSGLSMTDWKPLGSLPPLSQAEWQTEFDRYQQFPEFQQRKSMTLSEFQTIFYWEWGHRMMGRVVGLAFAVPWAYFSFKKIIPPGYQGRMALLLGMGGTQGLVGWWMVKSGLGDDRRADRKEIRVSPYRLAAHLGMAFSTYSMLLWTGLDILQHPHEVSGRVKELAKSFTKASLQHARKIRVGAIGVTGLTAVTVVSGAFVAGNDAGNAYNTFPLMDEQLIPYDDMVDPDISPAYRNLFETTAMVQWNHRWLGTSTALSAIGLAGVGMLHPASRNAMTPQVRKGLMVLGGVAVGQVSLGIATLLSYVPIALAAAHQLGSLVVLSSGIYVVHSLRYCRPGLLKHTAQTVRTAAAATPSSGKIVVTQGIKKSAQV
eukprot:scaffold64187_cov57-Attheya_sp.AAC.2